MAAARPAATSPLLDAIVGVSSLATGERAAATTRLLSLLQAAQTHFEEAASKHGSAAAGLPRPCCHDLTYVVMRLTRGLASSNAAARQGFAAALTELLGIFDFFPTLDVLNAIFKGTALQRRPSGDEVRDAMLGRVFGFLVLQRADRLKDLRAVEPAAMEQGHYSFVKNTRRAQRPAAHLSGDAAEGDAAEGMAEDGDAADVDADRADAMSMRSVGTAGTGAGAAVAAAAAVGAITPVTALGVMVAELVAIGARKTWASDAAYEAVGVIVAAAGPDAWREDLEAIVEAALPPNAAVWSPDQLGLALAVEEALVGWGVIAEPGAAAAGAADDGMSMPSCIATLRRALDRGHLQRFVAATDESVADSAELDAIAAGSAPAPAAAASASAAKPVPAKKDDGDSDSDSDSDSLPSRDSDNDSDDEEEGAAAGPLPATSAPLAPALLASTRTYPRLHSVWGRLLQRYARTALAALPKPAAAGAASASASAPPSEAVLEWGEVWRVYVDCLLLPLGPERKATALALLTSVLPVVGAAHPAALDAVLSPLLVRSLARNLSNKSRMLHAPARAAATALSTACAGRSDAASVALVALVSRCGHADFDKRTGTRVVAGLLAQLDDGAVLRHIAGAQREFARPSAAPLFSDIASTASGLTGRSGAAGGAAGAKGDGASVRSAATGTDRDVKAAEAGDDDGDLALSKPRNLSPAESRRLWALDGITSALRNDGLRLLRRGPVLRSVLAFLALHAYADVGLEQEQLDALAAEVDAQAAAAGAAGSASSAAPTASAKKSKKASAAGPKADSPALAAFRSLAALARPATAAAVAAGIVTAAEAGTSAVSAGAATIAAGADVHAAAALLVADPPLSDYMRSELRLRLAALVRHVTIAESVLAAMSGSSSGSASASTSATPANAGQLPDGSSTAGVADGSCRGALELCALGASLNSVWDTVSALQARLLGGTPVVPDVPAPAPDAAAAAATRRARSDSTASAGSAGSRKSFASASAAAAASAADAISLSVFPSQALVAQAEMVSERGGMLLDDDYDGSDDDDSNDDEEKEDNEDGDSPLHVRAKALRLAASLRDAGASLARAAAVMRPARQPAAAVAGDAAAAGGKGGKGGHGHGGASHASNAAAAAALEGARFALHYAALLQQCAAHMVMEGGRGLGLDAKQPLPGPRDAAAATAAVAAGRAAAAAAAAAKPNGDDDEDGSDAEASAAAAAAAAAASLRAPSEVAASVAACASVIVTAASSLSDFVEGARALLRRPLEAAAAALASAAAGAAAGASDGASAGSAASASAPASAKKDKKAKGADAAPAAAAPAGNAASAAAARAALDDVKQALARLAEASNDSSAAAAAAEAKDAKKEDAASASAATLAAAEEACTVFTDAALALLASSTATLRSAIRGAARCAFAFLSTPAVQAMTGVLVRSATDAADDAKGKSNDDDDDNDDDEESSDDEEAEADGSDSDDKKEVAAAAKGKGKGDDKPSAKRAKPSDDVAAPAAADSDAGSDDDDDDDDGAFSISDKEDGDDDAAEDSSSGAGGSAAGSRSAALAEMRRYDAVLANMLRARARAKRDAKEARVSEAAFKARALDLLATAVARLRHGGAGAPDAVGALALSAASAAAAASGSAPAAAAHASSSSSSHAADPRILLVPGPLLASMRVLAGRARPRPGAGPAAEAAAAEAGGLLSKLQGLLNETLAARLPPIAVSVTTGSPSAGGSGGAATTGAPPLLSLFTEAAAAAATAPSTEFVGACAAACGVALKALRPGPVRARSLLASALPDLATMEGKRREAVLSAVQQQPAVEHLDALAAGYSEALAALLTEPHCRLSPAFFRPVLAAMPALSVRLLPALAAVLAAPAGAVKPFKRAEAVEFIGAVVKAAGGAWSRDVPCAIAAPAASSDAPASGKKDKKKRRDSAASAGEASSSASAAAAPASGSTYVTVGAYLGQVLPGVLRSLAGELRRGVAGRPAGDEGATAAAADAAADKAAAAARPLSHKQLREAVAVLQTMQKQHIALQAPGSAASSSSSSAGDVAAAEDDLLEAVGELAAAAGGASPLRKACEAVLSRAGREVAIAGADAAAADDADDGAAAAARSSASASASAFAGSGAAADAGVTGKKRKREKEDAFAPARAAAKAVVAAKAKAEAAAAGSGAGGKARAAPAVAAAAPAVAAAAAPAPAAASEGKAAKKEKKEKKEKKDKAA